MLLRTMPQLKKEAPLEPELSTFNPAGVQAELDYWEKLIFSFDMDEDSSRPGPNSNPRSTRKSRPAHRGTSSAVTAPHANPSQVFASFFRASAHY